MIARVMLVMLLVAMGTAGTAQAQVYRWTDKNGKVHYGDDPWTAGATALTNVSGTPGVKRTAAPSTPASQPQTPLQANTAQGGTSGDNKEALPRRKARESANRAN